MKKYESFSEFVAHSITLKTAREISECTITMGEAGPFDANEAVLNQLITYDISIFQDLNKMAHESGHASGIEMLDAMFSSEDIASFPEMALRITWLLLCRYCDDWMRSCTKEFDYIYADADEETTTVADFLEECRKIKEGYDTENEAAAVPTRPKEEGPKNVVLKHFQSYNHRRYSAPWVCTMLPNGNYDFSKKVGTYTGHAGDAGDLVIFEPVEGQVYGYGQKDTRGGNTVKEYVRYVNGEFVPCDKLGR